MDVIEEIISEVGRRLAEDKWQDTKDVIADVMADKIKICELYSLGDSDVNDIFDVFGLDWDWDMREIEDMLDCRLCDEWYITECRDEDEYEELEVYWDECRIYALEFERELYIKY